MGAPKKVLAGVTAAAVTTSGWVYSIFQPEQKAASEVLGPFERPELEGSDLPTEELPVKDGDFDKTYLTTLEIKNSQAQKRLAISDARIKHKEEQVAQLQTELDKLKAEFKTLSEAKPNAYYYQYAKVRMEWYQQAIDRIKKDIDDNRSLDVVSHTVQQLAKDKQQDILQWPTPTVRDRE